jgi:hypothetical protein
MNRDLIKIERRLKEVLKPVKPPVDFVLELRSRLDEEMARKVKTKKVQTGLLVAGGIVSLAVMIVTIIRSIATWDTTIQNLGKSLPKLRKREPATSL